jgi:hypothetical protein
MESLIPQDLVAFALALVDAGTISCPAKHADRPQTWVRGLDPCLFLEIFGAALPPGSLEHFERLADADVQCLLSKLSKQRDITQLRNRRLQVARVMIAKRDGHFSDEAMAERDPALFERVMGVRACEVACGGVSDKPLSDMLQSAADGGEKVAALLQPHSFVPQRTLRGTPAAFEPNSSSVHAEDGATGEDSEPEDGGEEEALARSQVLPGDASVAEECSLAELDCDDDEDDDGGATQEQKRAILHRIMLRRFVSGEDAASFDYRVVDSDAALDTSAEAVRDLEEAYFDAE